MTNPSPHPTRRGIEVIVNASAGSGNAADLQASLAKAFQDRGAQAHIVFAASGPEMTAAIAAACDAKPDVIVAGGGDGTVSAVAQAAIAAGVTLGVLPLGTLNHFAKDAGVPLTLDAAVETICTGHTVDVDVGDVGGRIFLNNSSLGLYPRIVRHRDGQMRHAGRAKWFALFIATLTVLRIAPLANFRIRIDGAEEHRRTSLIMIGNNDYGMDGYHLGERKRLDAGHLTLYAPRHCGHGAFLWLALLALLGRVGQGREIEARPAKEIVIAAASDHLQVAIDGEVTVMPTPLRYRIRPGALRVLAPARPGTGGV